MAFMSKWGSKPGGGGDIKVNGAILTLLCLFRGGRGLGRETVRLTSARGDPMH